MQNKVTRDRARLIAKILTWMVGISKKVEYFFNIIEKWINKHETLAKLFLPFLTYLLEFLIIRFVLLIVLVVSIIYILIYKIIKTIFKHLK